MLLFPLEVVVGVVGRDYSADPLAVDIRHVRIVEIVEGYILIRRRRFRPRDAIAGTELELVNPSDGLHPFLVGDAPSSAHGREPSPAVVAAELVAPLVAGAHHEEEALVVVVVDTPVESDELALRHEARKCRKPVPGGLGGADIPRAETVYREVEGIHAPVLVDKPVPAVSESRGERMRPEGPGPVGLEFKGPVVSVTSVEGRAPLFASHHRVVGLVG